MKENPEIYNLEIKIPEQSPRRLEVIDRILAGIDPRNDLILIDPKIQSKHFLFIKREGSLTLEFLGGEKSTKLNDVLLENGKTYLLEKGDRLKVGKIEILIHKNIYKAKGVDQSSTARTTLPKVEQFVQKKESAPITIPDFPPLPEIQKLTKPTSTLQNFALIPTKIYGFLLDLALTYFVLGFILPKTGVLPLILDSLYPVSEFASTLALKKYPEVMNLNYLSLIEFFLCFHFLMIAASLVLGSTPGACLLGIKQSGTPNFLARRFKAYLYALLNVALLPFLLFDIPLFRGRTIKEWLSFTSHKKNDSLFTQVSQKAIAPLFIVASLLSPFFLPSPYNASVTESVLKKPKFMDPLTTTILSSSRDLGMSLRAELNQNYRLLPYFKNNKLGMLFYDLRTNKSLKMSEIARSSNDLLFYKSRFANPLASFMINKKLIEQESLKNLTLSSLHLSLENLLPKIFEFGPMLANGFLFKAEFLRSFSPADNFIALTFDPKNPAIKISGGEKNSEERLFLFTRKEVIVFSLESPKQTNLLGPFLDSIIAPLRFDQSSDGGLKGGLKDPQILEVMEAFQLSNYQTLLTYYINEAKKAQVLQNPNWQAFVKSNLEQTIHALESDPTREGLTKNNKQSLVDIINTL